jgi:hypothetical protein
LNNNPFPAHGTFKVSTRGRLLVINGEGPANVEMAQQYRDAVAPYRERLAGEPWASLVILDGLPLFPPEARIHMIDTVKQVVLTTEIVATGVVFREVQYENVIKPFWEEIYQKANLPYFFSHDEQVVEDWLLEQINTANHSRASSD